MTAIEAFDRCKNTHRLFYAAILVGALFGVGYLVQSIRWW